MRLVDCAVSLPDGLATSPMQAGYQVFRYLNVVGNVGQMAVRPCCHLPVMIKYDWKLRAEFDQIVRRLKRNKREIVNRIKADIRRLSRHVITDEEFDMAAYGPDNCSDNVSELCAPHSNNDTSKGFHGKTRPVTLVINKHTVC